MKQNLQQFIKDTIETYGYKGVVVGISGGIDSAVVAALCVNALGKDRVFGVLLPERDSSKDTIKDSILVCEHLGISYKKISITKAIKAMNAYTINLPSFLLTNRIKEIFVRRKLKTLVNKDVFLDDLSNSGNKEFLASIASYRVKHRIRMCYLYLEAERRNYAVIGTTNRTEYLTGFYVKWGDDATDIEPLLHLYKVDVYKLAKELKIPEKIILKKPSPDLIPGITDEFALGMSYRSLDRILIKIDKGISLEKEDYKKVRKVKEMMRLAKKRELKMYDTHKYFMDITKKKVKAK